MKRIRYLSLMLVLLCGTALWAQDDFNPTSPDEPGGPLVSKSKLTLVANPEDAAYSLWGAIRQAQRFLSLQKQTRASDL